MLPSMKRVRRQPNPTLRERWNMEPQTTQSLIRSKREKGQPALAVVLFKMMNVFAGIEEFTLPDSPTEMVYPCGYGLVSMTQMQMNERDLVIDENAELFRV